MSLTPCQAPGMSHCHNVTLTIGLAEVSEDLCLFDRWHEPDYILKSLGRGDKMPSCLLVRSCT